MNEPASLPSIETLKLQAKRLRSDLMNDGPPIGHSRSLELLAHQYGYRDWNTLYAKAGNRPPRCPVAPGDRVAGHYLCQAFEGEVTGVQNTGQAGRYRVTIRFDEPVDVVTFKSFSNLRRQVTCTIDDTGKTAEKTSNGLPQLRFRF